MMNTFTVIAIFVIFYFVAVRPGRNYVKRMGQKAEPWSPEPPEDLTKYSGDGRYSSSYKTPWLND